MSDSPDHVESEIVEALAADLDDAQVEAIARVMASYAQGEKDDSLYAYERWAGADLAVTVKEDGAGDTVPDYKVSDVYAEYLNAPPALQRAFRERMFTSKMYSKATEASEIAFPALLKTALETTANWASNNGIKPWGPDGLPPLPMPEIVELVPQVKSLAQIHASADSAAGRTLGRRANFDERKLAVSIIREFEAAGQAVGQADIESAFEDKSSGEASARGMEQTMSAFQRMIGGK